MPDIEPLPQIDLETMPSATATTDFFRGQASAPLVYARTDTELARAFLYSHALSAYSLKSTKKDLGRFLL
ncbi:MAG: hypothetical protein NVSMB6_12920 [Burkholderiaceae bacterium]